MLPISELQHMVHDNAINKGFWESQISSSVPTKLCLIHSEVSEAMEAHRDGDDTHIGEELADIIIRVMDLAGGLNINIEAELVSKHYKNLDRPRLHGNKRY